MLGTHFNIGDYISFSVYPAVFLGNNFKHLKVESVVNAEVAVAMGFDIHAQHANVFPTLPPGSPNSPTKYSFLFLQTVSNERICIGMPWINVSTITKVSTTNLSITVTGAGADKIELVRDALIAQGLTVGAIEVVAP